MRRSDYDVARISGLEEFSDTEKIPAEIFFRKNGGYLVFNLFLSGVEIITAHLLKSDEYIFGLYTDDKLSGFLYPGDSLSKKHQIRCFSDFFPEQYNDLQKKVVEYYDKIDYYLSSNDQFKIVGTINQKEIIQRIKKIDK